MEIKFSADEMRATVGLNASIEEALGAVDDADEFERILAEDVSGWVLELREQKGDVDAHLVEPMLQALVVDASNEARERGLRGQDLRKALVEVAVEAVTAVEEEE